MELADQAPPAAEAYAPKECRRLPRFAPLALVSRPAPPAAPSEHPKPREAPTCEALPTIRTSCPRLRTPPPTRARRFRPRYTRDPLGFLRAMRARARGFATPLRARGVAHSHVRPV